MRSFKFMAPATAIVALAILCAMRTSPTMQAQEADNAEAAAVKVETVGDGADAAAAAIAEKKVVYLDLLVVDIAQSDAAELKAGATVEVLEQLQALKQAGSATVFHLKFSSLENSPALVQFGESKQVVTGRQPAPFNRGFGGDASRGQEARGGGGFTTSTSEQQVGTLIRSTAVVESSGAILAEVSFEQSKFADAPAKDGDETDSGLHLPGKTTLNSQATVRIPAGQTVELVRKKNMVGGKSVATVLLMSGSHD